MSEATLVNRTIEEAYRAMTPGSAVLAERAKEVFPSGVTHDGRYLAPYGIYVDRAAGPHKWDVDGNRYVDFYGGHGALLLGHNHPKVLEAAQAALAKGTHFGANHPLEVTWGRLIQAMVPSARMVRFTSSGTEATLMALRLARGFTGRSKLLRFRTHFHGWHDHMTSGWTSHMDGSPTLGVLGGVAERVVLVDPNDTAGVRAALETDPDIAAVIIEPTGSSFGMVPTRPEFLAELRRLTSLHGALLIFDEVVTGFRVSPGGAQAHYGVTPDLTTLAKVVAGGLPGGALAGRADVLRALDFERAGGEKVQHPGTFNANPVSAAAGIAALEIIRDTDACARADAAALRLRRGLNAVLEEMGVPWVAYGSFSGVHLFTNAAGRSIDRRRFDPLAVPFAELKARQPGLVHRLRLAMMLGGVDMNGWPGGVVSAIHGEAETEATVAAFRDALRLLRREGVVAS
jgi:glutamate-1-semialdehyde 2,1-aminomutase